MERTASLLYEMYYKYRYKKSNIKENIKKRYKIVELAYILIKIIGKSVNEIFLELC